MKKKKSVKKAVTKKVDVSQPAAQEPAKKPVSGKLITAVVLAILTAITIFEVIAVTKVNIRASKKPALLSNWRPGAEFTGLTSMYMYNNSLYVVDSTRGSMIQYDAESGKFVKKYLLASGLHSMARLSNGDLVVVTGGNRLAVFKAGSEKASEPVLVPGCNALNSIAVDSNDSILALDSSGNKVIRLDGGLKKLSEFGAGVLTGAKKVYAGPGNTVYVMDAEPPNKISVKIFSASGSLVKKFGILKGKPTSGFDGLAVTPDGNTYVNCMSGNAVFCYSAEGKLLGSFNSAINNNSAFTFPAGIAGGANGKFMLSTYEMLLLQAIKY